MINRVSTASQYQNLTSNLMRKQGELNQTNGQLSSGKRVETAGDDPVSSVTIQNYRQQLTQIDQYNSAITLANNRLQTMETAIAGVEDNLGATKQKVLGMINGAMASNDRTAFKDELISLRDGLLELANSRDEAGNYVFSGNQSDTKPFMEATDGSMNYHGDSQSRYAQIDKSVNVKTSLPGDQLFTDVPNSYGDYRPVFNDKSGEAVVPQVEGLTSGSKLHLLSATTSDFTTAETIQVSFKESDKVDKDGNKVMQYSLKIGENVVAENEQYNEQTGIVYPPRSKPLEPVDPVTAVVEKEAEIRLKFDGISSGDSITLEPAQTINIFDSIQSAIDNAERPTSSPAAEANLQRVIDDLDSGFVHMNQQRSEVGTIMQQVDRQLEQHLDFELTLNQAQSGLEDLDYSKAIMDMNQQMMALQASQQAFGQTKQLSLFNYI
ncbi:flagellar hook-associated protein 3 [Photobacterium phosphoreum]|uniref:Flagellar hook-associated protein 3 n=2 Tax=Photobacterium phosphoreum TaxID=659 RepID=A0AAW4ZL14_PHOPO|nr:flagellar hook-associated protein FlgL [Photobacterium phosphoreum]MCD9489317.1 flagellar hook-associated protein 3 [Photobacterium phosphoreum]MCF2188973.1 flagellar hook-associated protein 3 [Photobacterium phosphoreum]MCF2300616.1 flagellar hook-associated protein 3 [Photobacterium phosphoreum]